MARGETSTTDQQGRIVGYGSFTVDMEFLVPESAELEGSWTLEGNSSWTFEFANPPQEIGAFMQHSAEGAITGDRSRFSLGDVYMHSDITAPGGPLESTDNISTVELSVSNIYCNDAYGEWILSWNSALAGANYTPTFAGTWYAVRQDPEFSTEHTREIFDKSEQLQNRIDDLYDSASTVEGVAIVPADALWDLIYDTVELANEARNLHPCDRALLGDDRYEAYIYSITEVLQDLADTLLGNQDVLDRPLSGDKVLSLVIQLQAGGVLGEGALVDATSTEGSLEADIAEILSDPGADIQEQAAAIIAADMAGLSLPEGFDRTTILPEIGDEGGEP